MHEREEEGGKQTELNYKHKEKMLQEERKNTTKIKP